MVANNHRNPHAKAHRPSSNTKLPNTTAPVKKERKSSICPCPKARSIKPRQKPQPGNRESAQSYGPRHLNLIYTAMSLTETSSDEDDRRSLYDPRSQVLDRRPQVLDRRPQALDPRPQAFDSRPQVLDLPSPNEPLLSVITTEQLRQSIRRKKVPPRTLMKPKLATTKEFHVDDFPRTLRQRKTSISEEEVIRLMSRQRISPPRQSTKRPQHQPRLKEATSSSPSPTSSSNSDGWVPCSPANTTPKKPPSLAKEDITVVRQHLLLQRASISSVNSFMGPSDVQRRPPKSAPKPVKAIRQQSVRRKVSVVVRKDIRPPPQQHFFRSIRPGINLPEKVNNRPAQKLPPLPREQPPLPREHLIRTSPQLPREHIIRTVPQLHREHIIRTTPQLHREHIIRTTPQLHREHIIRTSPQNCAGTRSSSSSCDYADTNFDNHKPRNPLPHTKVNFVKLGSMRGRPPLIPKEQPTMLYRPLENLPQQHRTFSISSTDSGEDHYTEPNLESPDSGAKEQQEVSLLEEDVHQTSFGNRDVSAPRSGSSSSNSSSLGSSSIEYFAAKSVTMTKRTIRSVSIRKSRYITPTFIKRSRSRVYETFRLKKSRFRPAKPVGPRDIDPYARYCKPLRTPYKSEGPRAPGIIRAMKVIVSRSGIAAIFRAICRRR